MILVREVSYPRNIVIQNAHSVVETKKCNLCFYQYFVCFLRKFPFLHIDIRWDKLCHRIIWPWQWIRGQRESLFQLRDENRISPIQSGTSRRDENFLTLDLRLRDEIEKNSSSISVIKTRPRLIIFILRLWGENEIFLIWSQFPRQEREF